MVQQALPQMSEVSVRVAGGRHAFVHLQQVNVLPRHVFIRQRTQHHPRRVAAADRHDEAAAGSDGGSRFQGNDRRGPLGDRVRHRKARSTS